MCGGVGAGIGHICRGFGCFDPVHDDNDGDDDDDDSRSFRDCPYLPFVVCFTHDAAMLV